MKRELMWPAIHAYRKAAASGDAPKIECPDCGGELVPVVGRDGDPDLKCLSCRIVFGIGQAVWDQIIANIGELVVTEREML